MLLDVEEKGLFRKHTKDFYSSGGKGEAEISSLLGEASSLFVYPS